YAGDPRSHACVTRRILDGSPDDESGGGSGSRSGGEVSGRDESSGASGGDESSGEMGGGGEEVPTADEAVILGARTGSPEEWERADRGDVTVVPPEAVPDWEPGWDDADVYLSVDIDGADPSVAPGTGTMEPFGLAPREMRRVVRAVADQCVGCDVVEVNDRDDGQAAALAGKLAREFVYTHADSRE
ncbi:MAG: arginase family protein, partial [Halobaculum sp.]